MTKLRTIALCLLAAGLFALFPISAHAAPLAPTEAGIWAWVMELPSLVTSGWHSIWDRVGSSANPDGQPAPVGSSADPDGQPTPGSAVIQGVGSSADPAGEPIPQNELDPGPVIDPMG